MSRSSIAAAGAGKVSSSVQMPVWTSDAPPTILRLRRLEEPSQQCQLDRLPSYCTQSVSIHGSSPHHQPMTTCRLCPACKK